MDIRTIGVVGAGQMGGGIAQVAAQAELGVLLYDVAPKMLERAVAAMEKSLVRLKEKGKLGARDVGEVIARIRAVERFEDLGAADLVIGGSLRQLPAAITVARRTRRIIRQNLAWALGYNLLALPLAAAGLVTPWLAALGMALSSLLVTVNALRLARVEQAGKATREVRA